MENILKEMFIHATFGKNLISAGLNGVESHSVSLKAQFANVYKNTKRIT